MDEHDCDAPIKTNAAAHHGKWSFVLKMRTSDFSPSFFTFHIAEIKNGIVDFYQLPVWISSQEILAHVLFNVFEGWKIAAPGALTAVSSRETWVKRRVPSFFLFMH